ncbi:MAG: HEAT repeat domain-containing protein [Thermodesulfobacteriota bacterium]
MKNKYFIVLLIFTALIYGCPRDRQPVSRDQNVARYTKGLENTSQRTRLNSASQLVNMGEEEEAAVPALLELLSSRSGRSRLISAKILGRLKNPPPKVMEALAIVSEGDVDRQVRGTAKHSLSQLKIRQLTSSARDSVIAELAETGQGTDQGS